MVKAMDLFSEQKQRELHKMKIYKKVYKRIEKKIILASSMNLYQCWYQIPEFLLNVPLYNLEDCKRFLEREFIHDGFQVYFTGDFNNVIVISWDKKY
jgi:hypothetical protein